MNYSNWNYLPKMTKMLSSISLALVIFSFLTLFHQIQSGILTFIDNPIQTVTISEKQIGCKTWKNAVCQECQSNYYFNAQGICSQVNVYCMEFNQEIGICQTCYQGYTVIDGACTADSLVARNQDQGCKTFTNDVCTKCSQRWYFNNNRQCQQVDDKCRTWDQSGLCLSCYNGFFLRQGRCIISINNQTIVNPMCKTWNGTFCEECSYRSIFNSKYVCQEVSPNCNTWDKLDGRCLSCYTGYTFFNGNCVISKESLDWMDPLCHKFDWQKKICLECSQRTFKNYQGRCTQVSPLCKTYNQLICMSCYSGYQLSNGQCFVKTSNQPTQPTDPGCAKWDWSSQKCLKCSYRYYFNYQDYCIAISDLCKTFDQNNGKCTSCYKGFSLNGNVCSITKNESSSPQIGCNLWNQIAMKCSVCSPKWTFDQNGYCVPILDLCKTFSKNGKCLQCYNGFQLKSGECTLKQNNTSLDPNCQSYQLSTGLCDQCSDRYVLDLNRYCVKVSDTCKTWDNQGLCTSCISDNLLSNGNCIEPQKDPYCIRYDTNLKRCLYCSSRFFLGSDGLCKKVSDLCSTWNKASGTCNSCYKGYDLNNGVCSITDQKPKVCQKWNSRINRCQSCSANYCLNELKSCTTIPQNCLTCDAKGGCFKCKSGYRAEAGKCVFDQLSCKQQIGNKCKSCFENSILFDGMCLTYEKLRLILNLYGQKNVGNST